MWSITVGGNSVLNVTNASVTFSAARRSAAISMDRQYSSGFFGWGAGDYDSFRIASIAMSDYVVPTYIGSGARIHRAATGSVSPTRSASSNLLPNSLFDNISQSTADITVDLTTGKFTVSNAGWYRVTARIGSGGVVTPGGGSSADQCLLLYKNGSIAHWGQSHASMYPSSGSVYVGYYALFGSFDIYLAAGDYVQIGYNQTTTIANTWTLIGEATGAKTYFEIALLNRSTV